jgi:hypothetical protein
MPEAQCCSPIQCPLLLLVGHFLIIRRALKGISSRVAKAHSVPGAPNTQAVVWQGVPWLPQEPEVQVGKTTARTAAHSNSNPSAHALHMPQQTGSAVMTYNSRKGRVP